MPSCEATLSLGHVNVLIHALAGWIKTVRGDDLVFGLTTDRSADDGTVHREFWKLFPVERPFAEALVAQELLFWGANKLTVGITMKGRAGLKELLDQVDCPNEYRLHISNLKQSFSAADITNALERIRPR